MYSNTVNSKHGGIATFCFFLILTVDKSSFSGLMLMALLFYVGGCVFDRLKIASADITQDMSLDVVPLFIPSTSVDRE